MLLAKLCKCTKKITSSPVCFHKTVHNKWCLDKIVGQIKTDDLEHGFVDHWLNSKTLWHALALSKLHVHILKQYCKVLTCILFEGRFTFRKGPFSVDSLSGFSDMNSGSKLENRVTFSYLSGVLCIGSNSIAFCRSPGCCRWSGFSAKAVYYCWNKSVIVPVTDFIILLFPEKKKENRGLMKSLQVSVSWKHLLEEKIVTKS